MVLKGKVAWVTGAGRGLGQGVVQMYARHGATVIAISRTLAELERTREIARAEGTDIVIKAVDLHDEAALRALADWTLQEFGRMDVLVNNAARLPLKYFTDMTMDDWDRTLNINLRVPVLTSMLFLPTMLAQGEGHIINVSSGAAVKGFLKETDYCASKFALEGFTKSLAMELHDHNIAVNAVTPGGKRGGVRIKPTSVTQAQFDALPPEEKAKWGDPIDLCESFVWLALHGSKDLTGKRVYAWDLSDLCRRQGWDVTYDPDTYA
ncbi:MAG: SDR family oxidoreductase [Chloroflexi bacterium]|nr:SDR family oxidoreductase [Chloroflexota bacterium]